MGGHVTEPIVAGPEASFQNLVNSAKPVSDSVPDKAVSISSVDHWLKKNFGKVSDLSPQVANQVADLLEGQAPGIEKGTRGHMLDMVSKLRQHANPTSVSDGFESNASPSVPPSDGHGHGRASGRASNRSSSAASRSMPWLEERGPSYADACSASKRPSRRRGTPGAC